MGMDNSRLRDQIVFLEVADYRLAAMDAARYLGAARAVRHSVARDLGHLPMRAFVGGTVEALVTTAENVYFDSHRRFADLDGSGRAMRAQAACDRLLRRLRRRP